MDLRKIGRYSIIRHLSMSDFAVLVSIEVGLFLLFRQLDSTHFSVRRTTEERRNIATYSQDHRDRPPQKRIEVDKSQFKATKANVCLISLFSEHGCNHLHNVYRGFVLHSLSQPILLGEHPITGVRHNNDSPNSESGICL